MRPELSPRKNPSQSRSQRMVDDLLDATAKVLIEEGWEKASTNRIARAAGVSVGSIYQYFPNKEALVLALARRHGDQMTSLLARTATDLATASLEHAVPVFVRAMFAAHRVEPELHVALVHQVLHVGLEAVDEIQQVALAMVRAYLEQHKARLLVTDLDAAAWMCVTTVEAAVHGAVLDKSGRLDDPAIERELCDLLLRYLVGVRV
jgi:AcrR family transcriptional regulator